MSSNKEGHPESEIEPESEGRKMVPFSGEAMYIFDQRKMPLVKRHHIPETPEVVGQSHGLTDRFIYLMQNHGLQPFDGIMKESFLYVAAVALAVGGKITETQFLKIYEAGYGKLVEDPKLKLYRERYGSIHDRIKNS